MNKADDSDKLAPGPVGRVLRSVTCRWQRLRDVLLQIDYGPYDHTLDCLKSLEASVGRLERSLSAAGIRVAEDGAPAQPNPALTSVSRP